MAIKEVNFHHFLELLIEMTRKELVTRYKYTFFGFLWLILNPILQMLVIGFVFRFFMKEPIHNYFFFLFIGLLSWNFFSLSLTKATSSIVFERSLIKKAHFPKTIIPLSIVLSNFVHLLISVCLFLIAETFIQRLTILGIFLGSIALLLLLIFTIGASLLSSALNVRFRDVNFFVQAILTIWFYATPVIYSLHLIPNKIVWMWQFNPLTVVIQLLQYGLLGETPPGFATIVSNIAIIFIISATGILVFHKESKYFDDWV